MTAINVTANHKIALHSGETILAQAKPNASVSLYWLISRIGRSALSILILLALLYFQTPDKGHLHLNIPALSLLSHTTIVTLAIAGLLLAIYALFHYAAKNYQYVVTSERVILTYGFLSINTRVIPYNKINDINVRASFFERLFGLASVNIDCIGTMLSSNRRRAGNNTTTMEGLTPEQCNHMLEVVSEQMTKKPGDDE